MAQPTKHFSGISISKSRAHIGDSITKTTNNYFSTPEDTYRKQKILNWFSPLNFLARQIDIFSGRQDGTGGWFLQDKKFLRWLEGTEKVLWCPGIPGAGKTVISSIVINHLRTSFQDQVVGIACIYCDYKANQVQTGPNLVSSLLKQLLQQQEALPNDVLAVYDRHTKEDTRPSADECLKLLHSTVSSFSKVFVVIDALDEIEVQNTRTFVVKTVKSLNSEACFMITSRKLPDIERAFVSFPQLEINASSEDIQQYLESRIEDEGELATSIQDDPTLGKLIVTTIVQKSRGMFLLARLHLEALAKADTLGNIHLALSNLPETLFGVYDEVMNRINKQDPYKISRAHQVLSWISFARRPLKVEELRHAMAISPQDKFFKQDKRPFKNVLTAACAGLVTIDEQSQVTRLVHETTQAYFKEKRQALFPNAQQMIATTCLTYLSFDVFAAGYCSTDEAFQARLRQNVFLDYAARNWGYHVCGDVELDIKELSLQFLEDDTKVTCATQVLLAPEDYDDIWEYTPKYTPKYLSGIHLCAYFGLTCIIKDLLKSIVVVDTKDSDGRTSLSWAAENGQKAVVKLLLENGANVDSKDTRNGRTPLSWAAENGHETVVKLLLENGADIDSKDSYGWTPLSSAAENGHEAVVKLLLEKGVDVDSKDSGDRAPLLWAVKNGHEVVVKLLLEKGADVESKDSDDRAPLLRAIENRHEAMVKLLLEKGADVNSEDFDGRTPLSLAAKKGHEAVVKLLLEKGADIDSKDSDGRTPLSWAAKKGHKTVIKLLLEKGVDIDSKNSDSQTPLWLAIENRHEAVIKLLLENGADIDSKDSYGWTPLLRAAEIGNEAAVKLLLEKRADIESKDSDSQTPLWLAIENGHEAVIKLLLEKEADIDSKDSFSQTPLSWAAENGHKAVVKLLLEKGADINSKNSYGRMPLLRAAENGHEAIVKLLLEKGADINSKNSYGRTPLLRAAENGHEAIVKLLLEKGADMDSKDSYSRTPLSWAARNGQEAVAKLLIEKGADIDSKDSDSRTPLSWAAKNGHEAVAKLLLEKEADIDSKDSFSQTPLSWAAKKKHEAVVKLLLEKRADANSKNT